MKRNYVYGKLLICLICYMLQSSSGDGADKCPSVVAGCKCNVKARGGIRISCRGLKTVTFQNLPSDINTDIDLSSNQLEEINTTTFPHPNRIRKLNLKDNHISEIKSYSFEGFTNLKKIDLSHNRLSRINESTFAGLDKVSMSVLNLQRNRILSISPKAFSKTQINKLILSRQLNVDENKAVLIGYHDFLSLSLVKYVNLDENNLLCDCNLKWLINWVQTTKFQVSNNSACEFPVQIRKTTVADLVKLGSDWDCDAFKSNFTLPYFQIYPSVNQILFENDSLLISCQSTWLNLAYIVWKKNGIRQESATSGINIRHYYNVTYGLYKSTLSVSRLNVKDNGNFSCQLIVRGSGTITASTKMYILNIIKKKCEPNVTISDRGNMYWPTALNGAMLHMSCPYGGLTSRSGYRRCYNSSWNDLKLEDCLFRNEVTRRLQIFYNDSKSDNPKEVIQMGKSFYLFFRHKFKTIKTKYDLFFIYEALHKIMKIYSKMDRTAVYSGFFWGTLGLISQTYVKLNSMSEQLYGTYNKHRFRILVESFVQQEAEKSGKFFKINNHPSMAALSYKQGAEAITHCYIKIPEQVNQLFQIYCSPKRNQTVEKLSSIDLQIVGAVISDVRITTLVYKTDTFFQHGLDKESSLLIVSPIVGVKIKGTYQNENSTSMQVLITFKDKFDLTNPRFMMWQDKADRKIGWKEYSDCTLLESHVMFTIRYQCHFRGIGMMTYFTLAMDKPVHVYLKPSYMEVILYVAAGVSCYFLMCTLVVYFVMSKLRFNRSDAATLMNLCLALIVSEFIFACGMHRTDDELLCKGVAMALHYFLLCALVWLGCGGVVLIRLLNKKKSSSREYDPVLKYYLVGWGLPLIICSVTIAYDRNNYGTANYCWLVSKSSLAAFICPGSLILLTDLIIFCCLHALINRIYPESEEDCEPDTAVIDKGKCSSNSCKLKVKSETEVEFPFPKRTELINYLHGCLSVLLLFCLTFTFTLMMYSYKSSGVQYLYYLFTYGSAGCNLLLGGTILFFHCLKREDIRVSLKQLVTSCCQKKTKDNTVLENLVDNEKQNNMMDIEEDNRYIEQSVALSDAPSNYGAGECILSESSPVVATVRVELCESYDGRGESVDNLSDHVTVPYTPMAPLHQPPSPTHLPSPARRPSTPVGRPPSPVGRPPLPVGRPPSLTSQPILPVGRTPSPAGRPTLSVGRPPSPVHRPPSPIQRPPSPSHRPSTPGRKSSTPVHQLPSPIHTEKTLPGDAGIFGENQNQSHLRNSIPNQSQASQSDTSEVEKQSVSGCNSIGDCSLTSGTHKRVRPNNPDIPENIKGFVPQDWKPARRRKKKTRAGESYYPYFNTDITPMTASYAYSSKSSSIASTTVSGVPLYINKRRAANSFAMYNDLFTQGKFVRPQINNPPPQPSNIGPQINNPGPLGSQVNMGPHMNRPPVNNMGPMMNNQQVNNLGPQLNNTQLNNMGPQMNPMGTPLNNIGPQIYDGTQPNMRLPMNNTAPQVSNLAMTQRPICFPSSPGTPAGAHKPFPIEAAYFPPVTYGGVPVNIVKPLNQERYRYADSGGSSVDIYPHSDVISQRVSEDSGPTTNIDRYNSTNIFSQRISEETEEEVEEMIKIAPIVYIPMPHVSIKQFEKPYETSV